VSLKKYVSIIIRRGHIKYKKRWKIKLNKKTYSSDSNNQKDFFDNLKKESTINNLRNIKDTNYFYFLGGFVEGEGSNTVSITVNKKI
jgi:hypothetical protein